ncbi:MAG: hypothetical protein P8020_14770 [Acidobacteriota bacterium]|jgi:hypothetical protein
MKVNSKLAVLFMALLLIVQPVSILLSTAPEQAMTVSQLDATLGGSLASTLCGAGLGFIGGSLIFASGGTAFLLVAIAAPKALAACLYWGIS